MIEGYNEKELYDFLLLRVKPQVGDKTIRLLLQHFENAGDILSASEKKLKEIPGVGITKAKAIKSFVDDSSIKEEIEFIKKHNIQYHLLQSKSYPKKLRRIDDAPSIIFTKGNINLQHKRNIAIVGTRHNTELGKTITEKIIQELIPYNVQIISGLAYGIDIISHKAAVDNNIPTVGVLAHGLDMIYPSSHRSVAKEMIHNGGLLTEYSINTNPDKQNFPMRNRIVAGLCDVLLVVETEVKGGSMITAKLASSYNKDVVTIPGRIGDKKSTGCNYLVKTNIANLVESAKDIAELMNWSIEQETNKAVQQKLFLDLSEEDRKILEIIETKENIHIDELSLKANVNSSQLAASLLHLELQNIIKSVSGKRYIRVT